jgi:hypothetical protein
MPNLRPGFQGFLARLARWTTRNACSQRVSLDCAVMCQRPGRSGNSRQCGGGGSATVSPCNGGAEATGYRSDKKSSKMKSSKAVIAGVAVAGLLTGSLAVRAYAVSKPGHVGVSLQTMADAEKGTPKHACKRQNECKGQGGCKIAEGGPGQNSCKGKGGCRTDGGPMPKMPKGG